MRLAASTLLALLLLAPLPAAAMIGGRPAPAEIAAQTAMIVSTRGASCTGVVLTRDLLLTAAHCVQPQADYAVVVFENAGPKLVPVERIARHPRFDPEQFRSRRPTPDLALVKLSAALPASFRPARIARHSAPPLPGDEFVLAGYGVAAEGDEKSAGKLRVVTLPAIGNTIDSTGIIMVRLSPGGGKTAGACTGDSGGPVYRENVVAAVIGWSTGAKGRGCGLVTGATLVAPQLDWIADTARSLGSSTGN
ncbi:MAG: trypsin-like serine protease [Bradyrhizobiaceae bacterium]|nr:trypsin-like serine protease [Bradyrhizobiaceae bacterium]